MINEIRYVLKYNEDAVNFFLSFRDALHLWDDLIDKDKDLSDEDINRGFWNALVAIPANPFYRKHAETLSAITSNAIANWMTANQYEKTGDLKKLQAAYIIRSDYANVLIYCAQLVGGAAWAHEVTPVIRNAWTEEDFEQYLVNLRREHEARQAKEARNVL